MYTREAGSFPGTRETQVYRVLNGRAEAATYDAVAVEEPLEIQLGHHDGNRRTRTLTITMRTPGNDRELAAGCICTEGIVTDPADIATILHRRNQVRVELRNGVAIDWPAIERRFVTSSSCGLCGKVCIDSVQNRQYLPLGSGPLIEADVLTRLPALLRTSQGAFETTGGLHAAALFSCTGQLMAVYEDVGRHNAVDKLIGAEFLADRLPLRNSVLLVSGRASFELVQKALVAGIPIMAAIGAPSSLAIDLAEAGGMTLVGFLREGRFNVYSGTPRLLEMQ
jgi:FdhD protein